MVRERWEWHAPIGAVEFRIAVIVLTGLVPGSHSWLPGETLSASTCCGHAPAMALNVFVPHVIGSIEQRRDVLGTA